MKLIRLHEFGAEQTILVNPSQIATVRHRQTEDGEPFTLVRYIDGNADRVTDSVEKILEWARRC